MRDYEQQRKNFGWWCRKGPTIRAHGHLISRYYYPRCTLAASGQTDIRVLPWAIDTGPELAEVGLTEAEFMKQGLDHKILTWHFDKSYWAIAKGKTDGFIKAIVKPQEHTLGARIAGPHAGELIQTWGLAMSNKLKIRAVAGKMSPYPALGEIRKWAAGSFYTPSLFSKRIQMIVRFLSHFS
jgi:hypothetical protein